MLVPVTALAIVIVKAMVVLAIVLVLILAVVVVAVVVVVVNGTWACLAGSINAWDLVSSRSDPSISHPKWP